MKMNYKTLKIKFMLQFMKNSDFISIWKEIQILSNQFNFDFAITYWTWKSDNTSGLLFVITGLCAKSFDNVTILFTTTCETPCCSDCWNFSFVNWVD